MYKYVGLERLNGWDYFFNIEGEDLPGVDAYVDGSYSPTIKKGGLGVYIVNNKTNTVIHEEFKDLDSKSIRIKSKSSLASELNAVLRAMEIAKGLKLDSINIVYDCHAVLAALWDTKVKNEEMYQFRMAMKKYFKNIYVTFTHAGWYNHHIHNNAHRLSRRYIA